MDHKRLDKRLDVESPLYRQGENADQLRSPVADDRTAEYLMGGGVREHLNETPLLTLNDRSAVGREWDLGAPDSSAGRGEVCLLEPNRSYYGRPNW